jgi:hypothetical protein
MLVGAVKDGVESPAQDLSDGFGGAEFASLGSATKQWSGGEA